MEVDMGVVEKIVNLGPLDPITCKRLLGTQDKTGNCLVTLIEDDENPNSVQLRVTKPER